MLDFHVTYMDGVTTVSCDINHIYRWYSWEIKWFKEVVFLASSSFSLDPGISKYPLEPQEVWTLQGRNKGLCVFEGCLGFLENPYQHGTVHQKICIADDSARALRD